MAPFRRRAGLVKGYRLMSKLLSTRVLLTACLVLLTAEAVGVGWGRDWFAVSATDNPPRADTDTSARSDKARPRPDAARKAWEKAQADAKDWPMYNYDVLGTRYNRGETAIGKGNAGRLQEKWRFPARDSDVEIGVIHATPVV